jgi:hypothetical protein
VYSLNDPVVETIQSSDITDLLVGIRSIYLNSFLERGLYGIAPSVQSGKSRKRRRLFSEADVYGIALVWMLFECGLRTQAIRRILNGLGGADANLAAEHLRKKRAEYIVVCREARKPRSKAEPEPEIRTARQSGLAKIIAGHPTANVLLLPIGTKFEEIKRLLEVLFEETL